MMISGLPIALISVGIDKHFLNDYLPRWNIFNTAWTFLIERFDMHCEMKGSDKGIIIIDKRTNMDEKKIKQTINGILKHGTNFKNINRIKKEPSFFPSKSQHGIQIADAVSYCTLKNLNRCEKFMSYWKTVTNKMRKSVTGEIMGYGLKLFPSNILEGYMTENPPVIKPPLVV
jgi:hypothetical protein